MTLRIARQFAAVARRSWSPQCRWTLDDGSWQRGTGWKKEGAWIQAPSLATSCLL